MARRLTTAERRYLEAGGDKTLARLRRAYREQVVSQVTKLVTEQTKLANGLDRSISAKLIYGRGGLTARSRAQVERAVDAMVDEAMSKFADRLDIAVTKGTKSTADATAEYLRRKGFEVDQASVRRAAEKIAAGDRKFYGATTRQRVKVIGKNQVARVGDVLDAARGNEKDRAKIVARAATPVGGDRTPGGSMLKEMTRVFVSDAIRKAADVDSAVMSLAGVYFAYRRLSDAHIFRGGAEVCEELNVARYPGISKLLRDAGLDPKEIDTRGLYPVDDRPDLPHSFCQCGWDPLVV